MWANEDGGMLQYGQYGSRSCEFGNLATMGSFREALYLQMFIQVVAERRTRQSGESLILDLALIFRMRT